MNEEEIVDQYMNGYCMFMAAALHHHYGLPVGLLTVTHDTERRSHAWVVLPSGKCLDIQGVQTLKQVCAFSEDCPERLYKVYNPTTLEHLEALAKTKLPVDDEEVRTALAAAQSYLGHVLVSKTLYIVPSTL